MQDIACSSQPFCYLQGMVDHAVPDSSGGSGGGGAGESGVGSPEGVVTGAPGLTYWDTAGQSLWIKDTGTGAVGWVQVIA